jgi:hypothetical protein
MLSFSLKKDLDYNKVDFEKNGEIFEEEEEE